MTDQPRPVWLTREQRNWLEMYGHADDSWNVPAEVCKAWDAAPADPARAVVRTLIFSPSVNPERVTVLAPLVLRALGMP